MTTDDGQETTGANKRADGDGEERRYAERCRSGERRKKMRQHQIPPQDPSTCVSRPGCNSSLLSPYVLGARVYCFLLLLSFFVLVLPLFVWLSILEICVVLLLPPATVYSAFCFYVFHVRAPNYATFSIFRIQV